MEILIVGILFVALMVYVSTKIKKNAAEAYEAETIETAEFTIAKPAGLMHPLRDDSKFAFEAYSNTYGDGNLRSIWQIKAELSVVTDAEFETVCRAAKNSADNVLSEENSADQPRTCLIESEKTIDGAKKRDFWKIVESRPAQKIYQLRIAVLDGYLEENADRVRVMIESFKVK